MNKFRSTVLGGTPEAPANPRVLDKQGGKAVGDQLDSVAIARDAKRSADHRDEDRHRLARETATVQFKGRKREVDLINLSGGGAMIEADLNPRLWDRVDLFLGEGSPIECAVRWLRNGRIGLEFAHETHIECDPDQRDTLLLEVIRRSFPDLAGQAPALVPESEPKPANKPAPEGSSRRGDLRHPLIWNGAVLWQHDAHPVRLRNISTSGVLVDAEISFPIDAEVMLDLGDSGQYFATVGWSRSGQAGLVFKQPFDLKVLGGVKPQIAPKSWDRPAYLDRSAGQSSPWANGWDRRELGDLRADLEGFLKR